MFTPEDVQTRIQQRPFVPLRIVTSAGEKYDIFHPDLIMIGRRYLIVGTASTENPHHFEQSTRIAVMHVAALEDLPSPTTPGDNGQGRA
jgi:hypothetical protein